MGPNRCHFKCRFHGKDATGTLTLADDGRFTCCFVVDRNVSWPVQGHWNVDSLGTLRLTTPHGYAWVTLEAHPDGTLTGLDQGGGFADFDIRGARSSALPRPLVKVAHA